MTPKVKSLLFYFARFTDSESTLADAGPCNIEVLDKSLTQAAFLEKFVEHIFVLFDKRTSRTNFCKYMIGCATFQLHKNLKYPVHKFSLL